MDSLFLLPQGIDGAQAPEFIEQLLSSTNTVRLERIVSWGHITPPDQWYDQEEDEWVLVLEGRACLGYADGSELWLSRGEHVLLPRHVRHRVLWTSRPCIWLALFSSCLWVSEMPTA